MLAVVLSFCLKLARISRFEIGFGRLLQFRVKNGFAFDGKQIMEIID